MGRPDTITKEYLRRPDIFEDVFNKYIKHSKDTAKLGEVISGDERFKSVERQAVVLINATTGSEVKYSEGKERVNMCIAIQEMRAESRLEGEMIGVIRTDKRRGFPQEDTRRYLMEEYQKSGEEVDELIERYWK